jgi:hypothetical protein
MNRQEVLFDDLVGAAEEREWNGQAQRLGGLEVDNQLYLCRLLHGQIAGFITFENSPRVAADQPMVFGFIASVTDQAYPSAAGRLVR